MGVQLSLRSRAYAILLQNMETRQHAELGVSVSVTRVMVYCFHVFAGLLVLLFDTDSRHHRLHLCDLALNKA